MLRDEPYVGDIFLLYSRLRGRFIHTGIVVGVQEEERVHEREVHVCVTVEGNTNNDGSSNGHTTLRKVRTFREADGHKFVRWVEMAWKAMAAAADRRFEWPVAGWVAPDRLEDGRRLGCGLGHAGGGVRPAGRHLC